MAIAKLILMDSAKIQEEEAKKVNKEMYFKHEIANQFIQRHKLRESFRYSYYKNE
jgi:metallo-beta-lactamase family protein